MSSPGNIIIAFRMGVPISLSFLFPCHKPFLLPVPQSHGTLVLFWSTGSFIPSGFLGSGLIQGKYNVLLHATGMPITSTSNIRTPKTKSKHRGSQETRILLLSWILLSAKVILSPSLSLSLLIYKSRWLNQVLSDVYLFLLSPFMNLWNCSREIRRELVE